MKKLLFTICLLTLLIPYNTIKAQENKSGDIPFSMSQMSIPCTTIELYKTETFRYQLKIVMMAENHLGVILLFLSEQGPYSMAIVPNENKSMICVFASGLNHEKITDTFKQRS